MSLTFPGGAAVKPGTNLVSMDVLQTNIRHWADENRKAESRPTYRAWNRPDAYFKFCNYRAQLFSNDAAMQSEFVRDPDNGKFSDLRKYMILCANVILSDFNELPVSAREFDYRTACDYNGRDTDLIALAESWAKEIDPSHSHVLTELCMTVEGLHGAEDYPIAYYSYAASGMRIYPRNMIADKLLRRMFGYDETIGDFTMQKLSADLESHPMSALALYTALTDTTGNYHLAVASVLSGLASWLAGKYPELRETPVRFQYLPIDFRLGGDPLVTIPIPRMPIISDIKNDLFSPRLLLIRANSNVISPQNSELTETAGFLGLCGVPGNLTIGFSPTAPGHAVVPPISRKLVQRIDQPGADNTLRFLSCAVQRRSEKDSRSQDSFAYEVTITLEINRCPCSFRKLYPAEAVEFCNNFPLITLLGSGTAQNPRVRLCASDYAPTDGDYGTVHGERLVFGDPEDGLCKQFNTDYSPLPNDFAYIRVSREDTLSAETYCCGYLFFDRADGSFFTKGSQAQSTEIVIDNVNNVARILRLDMNAAQPVVKDDPVYNDRLLFVSHNGRKDLTGNRQWGILNETIFDLGDHTSYAFAPFSDPFCELIAAGKVIVKQDSTSLRKIGHNWECRAAFSLGTDHAVDKFAPARTYTPAEQYIIPNPPFLYTVASGDGKGGTGYKLVYVANMGLTVRDLGMNSSNEPVRLDSCDLEFRYDGEALIPLDTPAVTLKIYGMENDERVFFGQIILDTAKYLMGEGFRPLEDKETGCSAILLAQPQPDGETQIVTGKVFGDNLLLIARDETAAQDIGGYSGYHAWRSGLVVPVRGLPGYEAVFPFSEEMLRNINEHNLTLAAGSMYVTYRENTRSCEVGVQINRDAEEPYPFRMSYRENEIARCDDLPFIIAMRGENGFSLTRFNNIAGEPLSDRRGCIDGTKVKIEYVHGGQYTPVIDKNDQPEGGVQPGASVPVDGMPEKVLLCISAPYNRRTFRCCALYSLDAPFGDGLYSVQSGLTHAQLLVDCHPERRIAERVEMFTDQIMWTNADGETFAHNTRFPRVVRSGRLISRIYSVPVRRAFTKLCEERSVSISNYGNNVIFYTDPEHPTEGVLSDTEPLYVRITLGGIKGGPAEFVRKYEENCIQRFPYFVLPTLTVFPYVDFQAAQSFDVTDAHGVSHHIEANEKLWNTYYYAKFLNKSENQTPSLAKSERDSKPERRDEPIGSRIEFYIGDEPIQFEPRSTKLIDAQNKYEIMIGRMNRWGRYIHMVYNGSHDVRRCGKERSVAPGPADTRLDQKEFGCIIMEDPPRSPVQHSNEINVGVDFGTRNSIVAVRPLGQPVEYPYHGTQELQSMIVQSLDPTDFTELTDLSYIPEFPGREKIGGRKGCGKFSSMVMTYTDVISPSDVVDPYWLGFVPNISGHTLEGIMSFLKASAGDMQTALDLYSDLKISTGDDAAAVAVMERNVKTFIKSILLHTVINCYFKRGGSICLRYSVPSSVYGEKLQKVWEEALAYMQQFLPPAMHALIRIEGFQTEALSLFHYLKTESDAGRMTQLPRFSVITDGGDGTYDFTINDQQLIGSGKMPPSFSLRYAGQQIMTDSIVAFFGYLVNRQRGVVDTRVKDIFQRMWNSPNPGADETMQGIINSLARNYRTSPQTSKTLVLTLIEQYGINHKAIFNQSLVEAGDYYNCIEDDYVNFVRMIQFKLLFVFNVLGRQIRSNIDFAQHAALTVFLYGGTAQAFTIAEPSCRGDLNNIAGVSSPEKPMLDAIATMLRLPQTQHGADVVINFQPAQDMEKREIATGLVMMGSASLMTQGGSARPPITRGRRIKSAGIVTDADGNLIPAPPETPSRKPHTIGQFVNDLIQMLHERMVEDEDGTLLTLDVNLPFLIDDQYVTLSEILRNPRVQAELQFAMDTVWEDVLSQNESIKDEDLIYDIFTLKMVGLAMETYLKN